MSDDGEESAEERRSRLVNNLRKLQGDPEQSKPVDVKPSISDYDNKVAPSDNSVAAKVVIQERRLKALQLRKRGLSPYEIAGVLKVSEGTVREDIKRSLAAYDTLEQREVEEMRHLELERLDDLWRGVYDDAVTGDVQSVKAALMIVERRSKLLGLDAPKQIESSSTVSFVDLVSTIDMGDADVINGDGGLLDSFIDGDQKE